MMDILYEVPFQMLRGLYNMGARRKKEKVRDHKFAHETRLLKQKFPEWNETVVIKLPTLRGSNNADV